VSRNVVATTAAPAAIGPYSQAIEIDGFLFCSGQLGIDPATGQLLEGIEAQTERALVNLEGVLGAVGLTFGDVVKVNVFIADLANFAQMNAIYSRHIVAPPPARSTVQVAALPLHAMVEIEAVARKSQLVDAVASARTR
jgi:2-iminobutanoate/2-iminopropanoate deaminase